MNGKNTIKSEKEWLRNRRKLQLEKDHIGFEKERWKQLGLEKDEIKDYKKLKIIWSKVEEKNTIGRKQKWKDK